MPESSTPITMGVTFPPTKFSLTVYEGQLSNIQEWSGDRWEDVVGGQTLIAPIGKNIEIQGSAVKFIPNGNTRWVWDATKL